MNRKMIASKLVMIARELLAVDESVQAFRAMGKKFGAMNVDEDPGVYSFKWEDENDPDTMDQLVIFYQEENAVAGQWPRKFKPTVDLWIRKYGIADVNIDWV